MAVIQAVSKVCRHPTVNPKQSKAHSKYKLGIPSQKYRGIVEKNLDGLKAAQEPLKLIKAAQSGDSKSLKELFNQAIYRGENLESLANSAYKTLNQGYNSQKALQEFGNAFIHSKIQEAVIRKDHKLLKSELAASLNIDTSSEEQVTQALFELKTPIAKRLASEIQALGTMPFERHQLGAIDALAICIFAENEFINNKENQNNSYYRGCDTELSRTIFLEPGRKTFTILSKKYGLRQAEGGFKRVTDAIEIARAKDGAHARLLVRLVNKADEIITDRELEFEKRYGRIISWYRYPSKKRFYEEKIFLLQEAYDHDLYMFTEYTASSLRKKIAPGELLDVLLDVGKTIETMHKDGTVHHDVKSKNVLYRKLPNGKTEAKLIDFGHTYRPGDLRVHLKKRKKGYGTLRYSSPDVLEQPNRHDDILMLAQAEDMFALGCLFYEVYMQKKTPWAEKVYACLKQDDSDRKIRNRAITLQKEAVKQLEELAKKSPSDTDRLLLKLGMRLLDSNPETRIKISEFLKVTQDIKARYIETITKGKTKFKDKIS